MTYAIPTATNIFAIPFQTTATLSTIFKLSSSAKPFLAHCATQSKPYAIKVIRTIWATRHFLVPSLRIALVAAMAAVMGLRWALTHASIWAIGTLCSTPGQPPTQEWIDILDPWDEPVEMPLSCPLPVYTPATLCLPPCHKIEAQRNLETLTVAQLRKVGQSMGIPKARNANRATLLAALCPQ